MERRQSFRFLTAIALAILISGCSISGPEVSIEDRIKDFEDDLDAGKIDQLYKHVHPDNNKRNQLKSADAWPFEPRRFNLRTFRITAKTVKVTVETTRSVVRVR